MHTVPVRDKYLSLYGYIRDATKGREAKKYLFVYGYTFVACIARHAVSLHRSKPAMPLTIASEAHSKARL